jgi:hypothetical protein
VGESSRGRHHAQHEKSPPPAQETNPPDECRALRRLCWEKGSLESTRIDQAQRCNTIQFLQPEEALPSQARDLQQQVPTASDAIVILPQMDESSHIYTAPSLQNNSEVIVITPQELPLDLLWPKQSHKQAETPTAKSEVLAPAAIGKDQQGSITSPSVPRTKDSVACNPSHLDFDFL